MRARHVLRSYAYGERLSIQPQAAKRWSVHYLRSGLMMRRRSTARFRPPYHSTRSLHVGSSRQRQPRELAQISSVAPDGDATVLINRQQPIRQGAISF
jgi:hypothetical protein